MVCWLCTWKPALALAAGLASERSGPHLGGQDTLIGSSCGGADSISIYAARRSHFYVHFLRAAPWQLRAWEGEGGRCCR